MQLEKLEERIAKFEIKVCEAMPFNITFFENKGMCKNPSDYCGYCAKFSGDDYFCNKKTYSSNNVLNMG